MGALAYTRASMSGTPVEGVCVWMAADGCIMLPTIGSGRMIATCTGTVRVKCEVISIVPRSITASVVPLLKREPFRRDHYRQASPLVRVLNPLLPSADASFGSDNVLYRSLLGFESQQEVWRHLSAKATTWQLALSSLVAERIGDFASTGGQSASKTLTVGPSKMDFK